jgi:inorganic pyrophosphatase
MGGDGDPLDVILLGSRRVRGEVALARVVGIIRVRDGGETDDKVIAVPDDERFEAVKTMADLKAHFPEIQTFLRIFWTHYKLNDDMVVSGFGEADEANGLLARAHEAWRGLHATTERPASSP